MHRSFTSVLRVVLVSCVAVLPCFWSRLVSPADLQSHLYNAWLANLVRDGRAPGLTIADQSTNVLVDLALAYGQPILGVSGTERGLCASLVLLFFWGALQYLSRAGDPFAWELSPWLAMLAYGFVFQTGLLNFYAASGCVLWALSIERRRTPVHLAALAALLALAWIAHPLPVVWAFGIAAYTLLAERLPSRWHAALFAVGLTVLVAARVVFSQRYLIRWSVNQFALVSGADQVLIYGRAYVAVFGAFLLLFAALALKHLRQRRLPTDVRAQLYVLCALATVVLPNAFRPTEQDAWSGVLCQRLSLLTAVLLLAALGASRARRAVLTAGLATAALFFTLLNRDIAAAGKTEAKIESLLAPLTFGERIVSYLPGIAGPNARVYYGDHLVARACIGRCFDYQNYEPATKQFRLRAEPDSRLATSDVAVSYGLEVGMYRVKAGDLPLHLIHRCGSAVTALCIKRMQVGERGLDVASLTDP